MSENEIAALFDEWNRTLQTGDPKKVTVLYATNGILLPTVSNKVRHNHEEIDEANVRTFGQLAINSGVYTFTFKDGPPVPARFTFVYRWNGERWMIVEHHSSQMPEQMPE